jgi:hypothetical protein
MLIIIEKTFPNDLFSGSIHIHDLFLYKNKESRNHRGICYQLKTFKITGTVNNICKI